MGCLQVPVLPLQLCLLLLQLFDLAINTDTVLYQLFLLLFHPVYPGPHLPVLHGQMLIFGHHPVPLGLQGIALARKPGEFTGRNT